jgi:hypothetical protein
VCLSIGTDAGVWLAVMTLSCHNKRYVYRLGYVLLASNEGLWCMELISYLVKLVGLLV